MIKLMFKGIALICFVMTSSCQTESKDISYKDLLKLENTHKIKKSILTKTLDEVLKDTVNYSKYDYPILLIISEKMLTKYKVCVSKTDYNIFKSSRPDTFNEFIGYSIYNGIPVLIFGDANKNILNLESVHFYNVLGKMPEYGRDNPPIIFEPRMKCYEEKL